MDRKNLFKKYYKNKEHDYEISETLQYTDDNGRGIDIAFIYSGRNRGKSFEISSQAIADAWYDGRQFGYIRRNDATNYEIEQYFADKSLFIKDMTGGLYEGITRDKGKLFFYKYEEDEKGNIKRKLSSSPCGYFFALSRQSSYKSLQFPELFTLIYEEVLTDGIYLSSEPEKLMNLYSTCKRSKSGFRMWLISNTVSAVNPYSASWGIYLSKNKPGDIRLSKLYLGKYDAEGHEEYLLIGAHYLKNKGDLTKEDLKKHRNRIKTSIASNKWDELRLYPTLKLNLVKNYDILDTVIFEYDDLLIQGNIIEIPTNLIECCIDDLTEEYYSKDVMPIIYFRRKTTEPKPNTRTYTNNAKHFNEYTTKGFKVIYKIDMIVEKLINRGWIVGADNLTMNDFETIYKRLCNRM